MNIEIIIFNFLKIKMNDKFFFSNNNFNYLSKQTNIIKDFNNLYNHHFLAQIY